MADQPTQGAPTPQATIELRGPPEAIVGVVEVTAAAVADAMDMAGFAPRAGAGGVAGAAALRDTPFDFGAFDAQLGLGEAGGLFAPLLDSNLPPSRRPSGLRLGRTTPGQTQRTTARFKVDPLTPPGAYAATFSIGQTPRQARVEVLAHESLSIQPSQISICGRPGESVIEPLVLQNTGNTVLRLGVLGLMVTEEDEQICLSLQQALANTGKLGHRGFLDAFVTSLAERRTDVVRVAVVDGGVELPPGEARSVAVAFRLPKNMKTGRRYQALLLCKSARLAAEITVQAPRSGTGGKSKDLS